MQLPPSGSTKSSLPLLSQVESQLAAIHISLQSALDRQTDSRTVGEERSMDQGKSRTRARSQPNTRSDLSIFDIRYSFIQIMDRKFELLRNG